MLVAYIWHFWIGVILFFVAILAVLGLVGGYLKSVTSQHYPSKRKRRDD
ncbi:MAG: hypothetical protein RI958_1882 [Actinomycetota bacterium]|jgi:hypothetical protein